jgi:hypothetical protein
MVWVSMKARLGQDLHPFFWPNTPLLAAMPGQDNQNPPRAHLGQWVDGRANLSPTGLTRYGQ